MKLEVGNFILVQCPKFGYSTERSDLGPYIVKIKEFVKDGIQAIHFLDSGSYSIGFVSYAEIICKIHQKDVEALFPCHVRT